MFQYKEQKNMHTLRRIAELHGSPFFEGKGRTFSHNAMATEDGLAFFVEGVKLVGEGRIYKIRIMDIEFGAIFSGGMGLFKSSYPAREDAWADIMVMLGGAE